MNLATSKKIINPVASTKVDMKGALITAGSTPIRFAAIGSSEPTVAAQMIIPGNANPITRDRERGWDHPT
jgi:hypothetical protein